MNPVELARDNQGRWSVTFGYHAGAWEPEVYLKLEVEPEGGGHAKARTNGSGYNLGDYTGTGAHAPASAP